MTVVSPPIANMQGRKNAKNLSTAEQTNFINGITKLINNFTYGELVAVHGDMSHNMHAGMNPNAPAGVEQQRFLPWHRAYLLTLEHMAQKYEPTFFIPYWDWANDQQVPLWIQTFLPNVSLPTEMGNPMSVPVARSPPKGLLPTPVKVQNVLSQNNYTNFAVALEGLHDSVHSWFGNNSTMADIMVAPADPMFFMHHANVDRIWSQWQTNVSNQNPNLTGDDQVLDPFPYKEVDTRSIQTMGYTYL